MMFIRHGMFARKGVVERRRRQIVGSTVGLLLLLSMAIIAIVKATGTNYDLGYTNAQNKGLTEGNITGVIVKPDDSEAANVDRDGKVKLNLEFNFTEDGVELAKAADTLTYDLSSIVTENSFIASIDNVSNPVNIVKDGIVIAKYTVSNGSVVITPEKTTDATNWWNNHYRDAKINLSVDINLDTIGAALRESGTILLPGTTTPNNASGNSINAIHFDTPHVAIRNSVYDAEEQGFKYGNTDKIIGVEKVGNDYIATYNTDFYMDAYASDLKVTIALDGNQTFVSGGSFEMATCMTPNCIHDSSATKISIPSEYINSTNNKTAEINVKGFLYDYCKLNASACATAGISGYVFNDAMVANNANGSDYYIQYKANLGQTNPAGNGDVYGVNSTISSATGSLLATDSVVYGVGISGSKTAVCVNGSATTGGVTTCNTDGASNIYVDYTIVVGDANTDLSNTTIYDMITDNQVLEGDITLTAPDNSATTIQKTNVCSNDNDNDCVVSSAIDSSYSSNNQKLFSHAFGSGSTGPWTITYRVKIPSASSISNNEVDNTIDLKLGQNYYSDVWDATTNYEFVTPISIEKNEEQTQASNGQVLWRISVQGPASGSVISDVTVTNDFSYDTAQYPEGSISNIVTNATVTANGVTTSANGYSASMVNGKLTISIPTLSAGEVYHFDILTQADPTFVQENAGESVVFQNRACRNDSTNGDICTQQIQAVVLTPDANDISKDVQKINDAFYWEVDSANNRYVGGQRNGYLWHVAINPEASSLSGETPSDYEPYFTDAIPEGLYLTNRQSNGSLAAPDCGAGGCDASQDINQTKYWATIDVKRTIPSITGQNEQTVTNVVVSIDNGVISPINLASLFNDAGCSIPSGAAPSLTCAGLNGATYEVTYATTLADDIYYNYAGSHNFVNQAKLKQQSSSNVYIERANAFAGVTYKNDSAIEKSDPTNETLTYDNEITYTITVNKDGYTYLNGGDPYASSATRPMLTITDTIPSNMNISTAAFSATNLEAGNSANNNLSGSNSIICTNNNNVIVNDCSFNYNSETRVLTAQVPDGYTRKIWYSVVVVNSVPAQGDWYENTASLRVGTINFDSTARKYHVTNGAATIYTNVVSVKKVDSKNPSTPVSGAKFKVVQVDYDSNGLLGNETTIDLNGSASGTDGTTGSDGVINFSDLCAYAATSVLMNCSEGGKLYYWQETSAPSPYSPINASAKHYFMYYNQSSLASGTEDNRMVAQQAADLVKSNASNNLSNIEVVKSNYQWVVTNDRQTRTSIAVEKRVRGNTARVEDVFTITVEATDLAGQPLNGTFDVYVYPTNDPTDLDYNEIHFTNGRASVDFDHGHGILIDGIYTGGTYTITEESAEGYMVSYSCTDRDDNGGCNSSISNSGTLVADDGASDPSVEGVGQKVIVYNNSSAEITGVSDKKPSIVIAATLGGVVAMLGIAIARRFRH